jgi:hypothetical protein
MRKFLFSGQEINKRGDIVSRQVVPLFTNLYNNTRISGIRLTKESVKAFTSALPSRAPASFPKKAGLQTFLHLEAPSRANAQWLSCFAAIMEFTAAGQSEIHTPVPN